MKQNKKKIKIPHKNKKQISVRDVYLQTKPQPDLNACFGLMGQDFGGSVEPFFLVLLCGSFELVVTHSTEVCGQAVL